MQRLVLVCGVLGACTNAELVEVEQATTPLGNLPHRGAFTCDLTIDAQQTEIDRLAALLEIDRMQMSGSAAAVGMKHKIVPITYPPTPALGTLVLYSGGRYLFDTRGQARTYRDFVTTGYVLDGVQFVDRSYFLANDCYDWEVVAASEYIDDYLHRSLRTERWLVPEDATATLRSRWQIVDDEARRRGYGATWLLYNRAEQLATVVTFDDGLDLMIDRALRPTLGTLVEQPGWTKTLDRDHYTLTNWQPFVAGDHGTPSAWPNYPLLPFEPRCGDATCEPSRGESNATCAADCVPGCGDASCGSGETEHNCPGDCLLCIESAFDGAREPREFDEPARNQDAELRIASIG